MNRMSCPRDIEKENQSLNISSLPSSAVVGVVMLDIFPGLSIRRGGCCRIGPCRSAPRCDKESCLQGWRVGWCTVADGCG